MKGSHYESYSLNKFHPQFHQSHIVQLLNISYRIAILSVYILQFALSFTCSPFFLIIQSYNTFPSFPNAHFLFLLSSYTSGKRSWRDVVNFAWFLASNELPFLCLININFSSRYCTIGNKRMSESLRVLLQNNFWSIMLRKKKDNA